MRLVLETDRLLLRPFEMEDAEAMFSGWASDPEVTKYLTWNTHDSIEVTKSVLSRWIEEYEKPEELNFAIVLKEEGKIIGGIAVGKYLDGGRTPMIGYNLARQYWRRGIMTEACRRLLEHLFSLGYDAVRIDAQTENIGSIRVIEKCGGEFLRTEEEFLPLKNKTALVNRYIVKRTR